MSCSGIDIFNPFSWIIFSGLLMGAAVTGLLKGKRRNWTLFSFFLSGSLLLALLGLFLPGPEKFLHIRILYFFIGSSVIGTAGTWLWKSLGLVVFLFVSLSIIIIPVAFRPWNCFTESIEVGRFRLVSQSGSSKTVEITMNGEVSASYRKMEGEEIEIEFELLKTEDYYFFLRERNLYRVRKGLFSPGEPFSGLPESLSRLILNYQSRIPGIEFSTVKSAPFIPDSFTTYVISLEIGDEEPKITFTRLYL